MSIKSSRSVLLLAFTLLFGAASSCFAAEPNSHWVGTWGSAQWLAEGDKVLPPDLKHNVTLRQIVRVSIGGDTFRLHVSNALGKEPLHIQAVHVARPVSLPSSKIDLTTNRRVTFRKESQITIPAGAELTSDPIALALEPLSSLAITMQLPSVPEHQTTHVASHTTSYIAIDTVPTAPELPTAHGVDHWYFLSGIDVLSRNGYAIVAIGDSITDGSGSTKNANNRWTDILAERLQRSPKHRHIGVLNAGIGGNRVLLDGNGPNGLARFDRDVLARSKVRYVIVLEGINDLGTLTRLSPASDEQHEALVRQLSVVYGEFADKARTHGIKVIGGTLLPFMGFEHYRPDERNELDRQRVNAWIRTSDHFDAVIDFDRVAGDPEDPQRLNPAYDSGDHIHPSPAGYRALGEAIPLDLFE